MTSTSLAGNSTHSGLRPVHLRTDLAAMTDLVELCFSGSMDEAGRAAIREMRLTAQSGDFGMLFRALNPVVSDLERGFVWFEGSSLVGNVSIAPGNFPQDMGKGFVVANVAVHPDFRRRGIAREMLKASLELIRQQGGTFAVLQVDATNQGAQDLYASLGFAAQRTFIDWRRSWQTRTPARLAEMPFMTLRPSNEWESEYELARLVRPNERGGLGWMRPTHPDNFRPRFWKSLGEWLIGKHEERWIVRNQGNQGIAASLHATRSFAGADRLELLVHPSRQGQLEAPLINYAVRRLSDRLHTIMIEHPADDETTTEVLERNQFARRFTTVHMLRQM